MVLRYKYSNPFIGNISGVLSVKFTGYLVNKELLNLILIDMVENLDCRTIFHRTDCLYWLCGFSWLL